MKNQALFSSKDKSKKLKMSSATILSSFSVNILRETTQGKV